MVGSPLDAPLLASLGRGGILFLRNPILRGKWFMIPSAVQCGPMRQKDCFKDERLGFRDVRGLPQVAGL